MIREKKKMEGKEKPAVREEEEDAVQLDADVSEEKALKEKENVEQKTKQKVDMFFCEKQAVQLACMHCNAVSKYHSFISAECSIGMVYGLLSANLLTP